MSAFVAIGDLPDDLADEFRRAERLAVDTETSGLDWRTDRLELVQLFAPATGPVLVRKAGVRPANLLTLLADPRVTKVFHYAPFDLRFLEATWGVRSTSVFCTKAASKLLDPELPAASHSLGALVERHFGIHLDKGAVRVSDWGSAQLTDEQLAYAVADVTHLPRLADLEFERLRSRGLDPDFEAICAYMPVDAHLEVTGIPDPLAY